MKKSYIVGSVVLTICLSWFVYQIFFIQEGEVVFETVSPTGQYKVFISEKDSLFSTKPKYVAAYVEIKEQSEQAERKIFYYSPDAINGHTKINWKNRDTIMIAGHELRLPLDRYHYLIR